MRDKYLDLVFVPSVQLNYETLGRIFIISNIIIGMAAGTLGYSAFEGIAFWFLASLGTSALVAMKLKSLPQSNGDSKYFKDAVYISFSNGFGNMMTFMLFWIMMYNVVHML